MRADSWPEPARQLLERAAVRHGGWERWRRLEEVRVRVVSLTGLIPWQKGIGLTFPRPDSAVVRPHAWETRFLDFGSAGVDGCFVRGDVRRVDRDGRVLEESRRHRATFRGLAKWRRWSALDAVYFFGYALATYLSLPFVLGDLELLDHDAERRWLTVAFPPELDSHGRRQRFYFAEDGLLVRHDYRAEVISDGALGCHRSSGYVEAGGMPFATERRVTFRLGRFALPVPVLSADLTGFEVRP
jgi:hypothetical protein